MCVDFYPGTAKPGRNPHSCWTQIRTVAVSEASPGVHSCLRSVLTLWLIICDKGPVGEA